MSPVKGINVQYIYSACVVTSTPDVRVLHDPWFTEGIYEGAWYHFPTVKDPLLSIGDVDIIYISHIHPDHYDGAFLKSYFSRYGNKQIIIADHSVNYLARKMTADGITPTILNEPLIIGNTSIEIVPHRTGSISDVDSALILRYQDEEKIHCVLNANDIIFTEDMRQQLKKIAGTIDILLCGFTGAGPFPQTYFDISDPDLDIEAQKKKLSFFERYKTLTQHMDAKINIPFAGKYILGGKLAILNQYRGVADPVEILKFDTKAVVLADNGGEISTIDLIAKNTRVEPYSAEALKEREDEISSRLLDYERLISADEIHQLPLKRLLVSASKNATRKSECDIDYHFCIQLPQGEFAVINANRHSTTGISYTKNKNTLPMPRSEILIDARYLFGLLTNVYHWNNAEIGSLFNVRRFPNILNRQAQAYLNFLAI